MRYSRAGQRSRLRSIRRIAIHLEFNPRVHRRHVHYHCPGDRRRPSAGCDLRAVFLRPHAGLGHDEHRQLCARRFRHARHVRGLRGLDAVRRRSFIGRATRSAGAGDAWCGGLFRTDPRDHERADAGPNSRHLRAGAAAALLGLLVVRRQLPDVAGKHCRRQLRCIGLAHPGFAAVGRRGCVAGDARPAPSADADLAWIEDAGRRGGFHRGAIDGHPA